MQQITLIGNIAVVNGWSQSQDGSSITFLKSVVRGYNISTGQLLWEDVKNKYSSVSMTPAHNTYLANNRIFNVGPEYIVPDGYTGNFLLSAYQVGATGTSVLPLLLNE